MLILRWILIVAFAGYCAVLALLVVLQRSIMYPAPEQVRTSPAALLPRAEEIVLDTKDGERVIVWHVPPKGDKPVVIFFHGNREVLAWRARRFRALTEDGTGLVALSFRGYAGSTGSPSEAGLLQDGAAAYAFAAARYPADRIVLWGYSLGSGVAVAIAATQPVAKVILEAPYTSTVEVAAALFPFYPVHWLMHDTFRSDERIAKVTAPLLIMHGEDDRIIAVRFGEKLYSLAPGPKKFVRFVGGTHMNLDGQGALAAVRAFLADGDP